MEKYARQSALVSLETIGDKRFGGFDTSDSCPVIKTLRDLIVNVYECFPGNLPRFDICHPTFVSFSNVQCSTTAVRIK